MEEDHQSDGNRAYAIERGNSLEAAGRLGGRYHCPRVNHGATQIEGQDQGFTSRYIFDVPAAERSLPYQPAIDGLRALSIVAVMLFHAAALARLPEWFTGGFLGVTVFFVVSGYLITTLLLKEAVATRSIKLGGFWSRRARRLAPASLTVVLAAILITNRSWSAWPGFHAADALAGTWGVMNWQLIALGEEQIIRGLGPLTPYWSLAIEEQFYVLLALGLAAAARSRTPPRTVALGLGAAWVTSLLAANLFDLSDLALEYSLITRAGELATGGLLAVVVYVRPTFWADSAAITRWAGPTSLAALLVLFVTASLDPPWLLHGGFLVVAAISAVLLTAVHSPGPLRTALGMPQLVWVGKLSYSLYLVHWPIGLLLNANTSLVRWGSVTAQLVASFVVAIALHYAIERPLRYRTTARPNSSLWIWAGTSAAVSVLALALLV
jgi:peptidoglycan/LPS O-acetylase OafA/YrhL